MKTPENPVDAAWQQEFMTLHSMVSRLVAGNASAAARNRSFLINDVSRDLAIISNSGTVATVLNKVIATSATTASDTCIRISAKMCGNIILVQIKDHHSINPYTIALNLQPTQPIAETIGGYVGVTSKHQCETTIVFSFPNIPIAA
jgi:hypothetical protein